MAEQCNWDPKKHGGRPCPKHGSGGLWDENVLARKSKLKEAGYEDADLEDEDLKEDFDDDYEEEFVDDDTISEALGDATWSITDATTVGDYANQIAQQLKVPRERVLDVMKKETPQEISEDMKLGNLVFGEDTEKTEENKPTEGLLDHDERYKYALLDRLRADAEYYLNAKSDKYLWSGNPKQHIIDMKALYNSFDNDKKPEWLTEEKINEYEKEFEKIKKANNKENLPF